MKLINALREKCPNTELFLWSVFGHFSRSDSNRQLQGR